ncbi:cysteine-rich secretory protein 1 [Tamandua tetradactyla]|uniref:cysteine-rich secretory protein 1 n=1 Tax=Tamandua tetradactyla TaxID=48850 RepID=UPI004053A153
MDGKQVLLWAAAIGFLPVLVIRAKPGDSIPYRTLSTESAKVQEEIVSVHNSFRKKVIPQASNMLKMSWSEHAALNAKNLALQCDPTESNPLERRITSGFCGENLQWTSYPISWSDVIGLWYNESKYFTFGVWLPKDELTDHYTQVVWATSYLIGCSFSLCSRKKKTYYFYICHYCHEGNDPDTIITPYNMGLPCGDCPDACEDRLCTNPCPYADEIINCKEQIKILGCSHQSVELLCKASCLCKTQVK